MSKKQRSRPVQDESESEFESESVGSESGSKTLDDGPPPTSINPYGVLEIEKTASAEQVRSAYRKLALRNHPDKVGEAEKDAAHQKFQEIAFAYAILSDPHRRSRYDTTGRTNESLDDDDDFNWSDFFRSQFEDVISADSITQFKSQYQDSEEERKDVIAAYVDAEGDMNELFTVVMLSNPIDDEKRFRVWIDEDIKAAKIEGYRAYTKESAKSRKARLREAQAESQEAEEYAKELGIHDKLFGGGKGKKKKDDSDQSGLAALIQQRQKARAGDFLAGLEEKYARQQPKARGGAKRKRNEPPEELFEKNRQKAGRAKR